MLIIISIFMEEAPISIQNSRKKKQFLTKFNIFKKKSEHQIILLITWIISGLLLIFYIFYQSLTQDLIENEKLPRNITWILILSLIILFMSILVLFLLKENINQGKNSKSDEIEKIEEKDKKFSEEMEILYNNHEYERLNEEISHYLEYNKNKIPNDEYRNLISLLEKVKKINLINLSIQKIEVLLSSENIEKARIEYKNTNGFINHHLNEIPEEILNNFDKLYKKLT